MLAMFLPLFKEVILTKNLHKKMLDEARRSSPLEGCGVLFGHIDDDRAIIREVVETENSAENPSVRFYIDPELFYKVLTTAEEQGLEFVKMGSRRITDAIDFVQGENSMLKQRYQNERLGWNLYYDTLEAVEDALKHEEGFALDLRKKAQRIIDQCAVGC